MCHNKHLCFARRKIIIRCVYIVYIQLLSFFFFNTFNFIFSPPSTERSIPSDSAIKRCYCTIGIIKATVFTWDVRCAMHFVRSTRTWRLLVAWNKNRWAKTEIKKLKNDYYRFPSRVYVYDVLRLLSRVVPYACTRCTRSLSLRLPFCIIL